MSSKSHFDKPRLNQLFDDLNATLKDFIRDHHVTYAEYHRALSFLTEVGGKIAFRLIAGGFGHNQFGIVGCEIESAIQHGAGVRISPHPEVGKAPVEKRQCIARIELDRLLLVRQRFRPSALAAIDEADRHQRFGTARQELSRLFESVARRRVIRLHIVIVKALSQVRFTNIRLQS